MSTPSFPSWTPVTTALNPLHAIDEFRHEHPDYRGYWKAKPTSDGWYRAYLCDYADGGQALHCVHTPPREMARLKAGLMKAYPLEEDAS